MMFEMTRTHNEGDREVYGTTRSDNEGDGVVYGTTRSDNEGDGVVFETIDSHIYSKGTMQTTNELEWCRHLVLGLLNSFVLLLKVAFRQC